MALIFADRVQETSATGGTGTLTLGGAVSGCVTFNSIMDANDTCYYCIDNGIGNWEIGLGTYGDTDTLARTTVIKSSNSHSLVNFGTEDKRVFLTQPAFRSQYSNINVNFNASIATTSNTDCYLIAPETSKIASIVFSGTTALTASDTNYITFSVTNLGQTGTGTTAILDPVAGNTTKATGGSAIAAHTKRTFTLHSTAANLDVVAGDRLLIRAAATGTLANTVTFPTYLVTFQGR